MKNFIQKINEFDYKQLSIFLAEVFFHCDNNARNFLYYELYKSSPKYRESFLNRISETEKERFQYEIKKVEELSRIEIVKGEEQVLEILKPNLSDSITLNITNLFGILKLKKNLERPNGYSCYFLQLNLLKDISNLKHNRIAQIR